MENIETILASVEGLTEEQANAIKKGVAENYRTIAEVEAKKQKLDEAQKQLETLNGELAAAKELTAGNGEQIEQFKAKIAELEKAQEEQKAKETEEAKRSAFDAEFAKATEGKQFANSFTRDSIASKAYEIRSANPDMGIDAVLSSVTEGQEGIWANPQRDPIKQPAGAKGGTPTLNTMADLQSATPDYLIAHMDEVNAILSKGE